MLDCTEGPDQAGYVSSVFTYELWPPFARHSLYKVPDKAHFSSKKMIFFLISLLLDMM